MEYVCPVCARTFRNRLWSVVYFSKEDRVALKLMEVGEVCAGCWQSHIDKLGKETVVDILINVMDEHTGLEDSYKELEEERDDKEEELEDRIKDLTEELEEIKEKVENILK